MVMEEQNATELWGEWDDLFFERPSPMIANYLAELAFGACMGIVGALVGWLLGTRGAAGGGARSNAVSRAAQAPAAPEHAPEDREERDRRMAREVLSRVQELTTSVAHDVDEHNTRVREINANLTSQGDDSQAVVAAIAQLIEANERMERQLAGAEEQLQHQAELVRASAEEARTDALTQVNNRRAFDDELQRCLGDYRQSGAPATLMLFDVDHFKQFNDAHGHLAGDEVLRGVARRLKQTLRPVDFLARYGGEEFAVIFPATTLEQARPLADGVRQTVEQARFQFEGKELNVTASLGLSQVSGRESHERWIQRADEALYASKHAGRNCVHWHDGQTPRPLAQASLPPAQGETPLDENKSALPAESEAAAPAKRPRKRDELTGCATKEAFGKELGRRAIEWKRGGSPISLVVVDIDHFDRLAAERGKAASDLILRATTQFLRATIRDMDSIARLDDARFGLLLPNTRLNEAARAAERLRQATSRCELPLPSGKLRFSISLGVAEISDDDDHERLLARGEEALAHASQLGRNATYLHDGEQVVRARELLAMA